VKDFIIQGGDPTGTGDGGESIYGHPFKDEFHSRLRFSHRFLVACANKNSPDTNNSQFFITLDRTDYLDRKNTIFGKVNKGKENRSERDCEEIVSGRCMSCSIIPTLLRKWFKLSSVAACPLQIS
jgi:cyclophilin family peptidyl-prolyl cis-trans isomerase